METRKIVTFNEHDIILKNNQVQSAIIPASKRELSRNVTVTGNVEVEGAVYANKLEIENGDATFCKSIYAEQELYIHNTAKGSVIFRESCGSTQTVSAQLLEGRAFFASDINAPKISLRNCFVAGSLFGKEISLENCIVLGGCFASEKFVMNNSMVGLFNTTVVESSGINYLLYPTAFSVEKMRFIPGTKFYNLSLADLGSLFKHEPERVNSGKIEMDMETDSQKMTLKDEQDIPMIVNSYSVAARVIIADMMDLEKMENHFLITAASLGSQLLKTYSLVKGNGESSDPLDIEHIAPFFFDVLEGRIEIQMLDAKISFDDLKAKMQG